MFDPYLNGESDMPENGNQFGVWTYDGTQSMLRRQKIMGQDTIGDLRVTYKVPQSLSDTQASILGTVKGGKVTKINELRSCA